MPDCEKIESGRLIVRKENNRKIVLVNNTQTRVNVIKVDGCEITVGLRCDYLFIYQLNANEYFVEFKGVNTIHACDQLEATILQLTANMMRKKYAFIVGGRVAPAINTTIQKKIIMFRRKYNAELVISNIKCCFDLVKDEEVDCSRI